MSAANFSNTERYNTGPVVYFLGHGMICDKRPPQLMKIGEFDCISMVSDIDPVYGPVLRPRLDHAPVLEHFLRWHDHVMSTQGDIVAQYLKRIVGSVQYVKYISEKFEHIEGDAGDHYMVHGITPYDLRSFSDRVALMSYKVSLEPIEIEKIQRYQKIYMSIDGFGLEIRERMVAYTCGLLFEKQQLLDKLSFWKKVAPLQIKGMVPSEDTYIKLSHKFTLSDNSANTIKVTVLVYLNKSALKHDILMLNSSVANFTQYTEFYMVDEDQQKLLFNCRSGSLSGKQFIFIHMQCIKSPCYDLERPCSSSIFTMSDVLNVFVSKLHVFIQNTQDSTLSGNKRLGLLDKLGDVSHNVPDGAAHIEWQYYDLAMLPESTIVLGSCSGTDAVVNEIFGF